MLGIHTQRAMLTLLIVSIPLAIIWFYTGTLLLSLGQDAEISTGAGTFNRWLIPSLFAYGLLQCLNRLLQTQNNVFPMMLSSGATSLLHIIVCWGLVFKSGLGSKGAALAITISNWINVFMLAIYVKYSPTCAKTWTGFSKEALHDIFSFVKLAVPSAIMIWQVHVWVLELKGFVNCMDIFIHFLAYIYVLYSLEYWSFEMVVLLSGLLPNPKLEASVLSIRYFFCQILEFIL